ncbi:MAG: hypothetical protein ACTSV1_08635, partial [Alphaproteobacteria bacterium]
MKLGFIFPSSYYLHDPFRGDPHTHYHLLTILEDKYGDALDLQLIDLRGIEPRFADYHIPDCDIYLHSIYSLDWDEHLDVIGKLRQRNPGAPHVAGGPNVHFDQKGCLDLFDAIVLGEGEKSVIRIVEDFRDGKLQRIYDQGESTDVNLYPVPRRHFSPKHVVAKPGIMTLKNTPGYDKLLGTTVVFSRGCPYKCLFCAMPEVKTYSPAVRYRS